MCFNFLLSHCSEKEKEVGEILYLQSALAELCEGFFFFGGRIYNGMDPHLLSVELFPHPGTSD